jgi:pimeloyl-ACP methyl ester carboxylesterase
MTGVMRPVGLLLAAWCTSGCLALLPANVPMQSLRYDLPGSGRAKCLLVLLPGAGDDDTAFEKQGFVDAVRAHGLSVDVVAANATLGYYMRGIVWDRLAQDVIGPAQKKGYAQTWLAGISMGGLGAFLYGRNHPSDVTGVLGMAPFLGEDALLEEIHKAGGLAAWHAPPRADPLTRDNYQAELWRWLQAVTGGREQGPALYLGYGDDDKLVRAAHLLEPALPAAHVFETGGRHDWGPWWQQWQRFLTLSEFARGCAPDAPVH